MTPEEFQRLTNKCQPHPVFKTDWQNYYPEDFAQTFLPKVAVYKDPPLFDSDGAELLKGLVCDFEQLKFNDNKDLIFTYFYSYPKGVLAEQKKRTISVSKLELCIFVEISQDDSLDIYITFGSAFRNFLETYSKTQKQPIHLKGVYQTNFLAFKTYFGVNFSQAKILKYILSLIGINFDKTYPLAARLVLPYDVVWVAGGKRSFRKLEHFIPLGIVNPVKDKGLPTAEITVMFEIMNQPAVSYTLTVKSGEKTIYQNVYEAGVIIKSKSRGKRAYFEPAVYEAKWDGFDTDGVYDSRLFEKKLDFVIDIMGNNGIGTQLVRTIEFERVVHKGVGITNPLQTKTVDWLDVKIDKNTKKNRDIIALKPI